jgi:UDPglucose--hexose-1-phosphate uridylyltransferase
MIERSWEERWHPLREEWVIIAAHRNSRPWSGASADRPAAEATPEYLSDCYLCPGNHRVSGTRNEDYSEIFVFDNDLPCVGKDAPMAVSAPKHPFYRNRPANGIARVVCYSPLHNTTLAEQTEGEILALLECWQAQYSDLADRPEVNHVLTFENKGKAVGVSNPHPHCQIYATNFVFKTISLEVDTCRRHWLETGRVVFEDILEAELSDGRRILAERDSAIAFLPYFARFAYETFVAPKQPHQSIADLTPHELRDLASVLKDVLVRFDNLWQMSFPYVLVLHQAPTDGKTALGFHFHIEIHPPLRTPQLLKYLAGPELGGGSFLSDTSPEEKAAELQAQPSVHYKQQSEVVCSELG